MPELKITKRGNDLQFYEADKLEKYLLRYVPEGVDVTSIVDSVTEYVELVGQVTSEEVQKELYSIVEGRISVQESYWQNVAGCIRADILRREVYRNRGFVKGLKRMFNLAFENGQYTDFFKRYTDEEIQELEDFINHDNDYYVNHAGVHIAYKRYVTSIPKKEMVAGTEVAKGIIQIETLQERYMAIAMFLHVDEPRNRMKHIKRAYKKMSAKKFTPATPTFMNSGRPNGNLSSCFIGMVEDSINGIYDEAKQFAQISKNAGGYGLYFGKVRSLGASIRNMPGKSSGSVPFMKLFDVTAGAVDQQGQRAGAVTITQDIWHRDLDDFLKTPLNTTVLSKQMHGIFLAVSIPDAFYRALQEDTKWYQFDPHEVKQVMGWALEDCYDETKTGGTFSDRYNACIAAYEEGRLQLVSTVDPYDVIETINKTRVEKGHPFIFNRDVVNRDNPNGGMIYSSNLCMEIAIQMSLPEVVTSTVEVDGEQIIRTDMKPGDIPTCNLSSFNLSQLAKAILAGEDWKAYIAKVIPVQYRMLANVIKLNDHSEMPQTKISSLRKREVGLGVMGLAHAQALLKLAPDSEAAIDWMAEVSEEIAYRTIEASMNYAIEFNDVAPAFYGSKWEDGSYIREKFKQNSKNNKDRWEQLAIDVMKNGLFSVVLMATAPTETISYIANTSAGCDPVFNREYTLEKAGIKTNMVAHDIDPTNFFFYKDAFVINKSMFLKGVGARQDFIDQSISTNLYYIKDNLDGFDLLQDYIDAWKAGVKTIYYHRSQTLKAYEIACESCSG